MLDIEVKEQSWPIRGEFRLSRGAKTTADTLQMRISDGVAIGLSEVVPYKRYGETIESVKAQVDSILSDLKAGMTRQELQTRLPAGAARSLCDLALWDFEAKQSGQPVWRTANLPEPRSVLISYTLSLAEPEVMAQAALMAAAYPLLKIKLGTPDDVARLRAIHEVRPHAKLIVDANEGWTISQLEDLVPIMVECGVVLCEQTLPVVEDHLLVGRTFPFLLCADESIHTAADTQKLGDRYQAVNIKLDKTGGLTEALHAVTTARAHGMQVMIGCMVSSSLAVAPAVLLAGQAEWVDLDGPLLLATDYSPSLHYQGSMLSPLDRALWG